MSHVTIQINIITGNITGSVVIQGGENNVTEVLKQDTLRELVEKLLQLGL